EKKAQDLEVRVYVGAEDEIILEGYELVPISKENCLPPACLKSTYFSSNTPFEVANVKKGKLYSDGKAGFLLFGPYVPINAGQYVVKVYGRASSAKSAWVDVVSGKGTIQHGKFAINPKIQDPHILATGWVKIEKKAQDLEVRVYVGAEDEIILEGYELVPISKEK
ncbi:MAG: hypothetical protein ACU83P_07425, partial [Gammaproteobacteria bacterium]